MGYGTTTNTILLPDEEEQLVREELNRIANNPNAGRSGHGTTSPGREGYVVKKYHLETCLNKELNIKFNAHVSMDIFYLRGGFGSDAGSSAGDSLGRPDSLGPVDDDEDRIPEELLLKYVVRSYMYRELTFIKYRKVR